MTENDEEKYDFFVLDGGGLRERECLVRYARFGENAC